MKSRYKIWLLILFWCGVFGCVYLVGRKNNKPKDSTKYSHQKLIERMRYWCAEIEYYDTITHSLKQYYSQVKENSKLDGIYSFTTENGILIDSTQFLNDGRLSINGQGSIADITIKDGKHYKITELAFGKCGNKSRLDSLKKHFVDELEEPDPPTNDDN